MPSLTSFSEIVRKMYADAPVERIRKAIVTGRSRGVRGLPLHLQPPIYDTPADAPWKVRVREWHAENRERDPKQWHGFWRVLRPSNVFNEFI